jgi:hypothetical protein
MKTNVLFPKDSQVTNEGVLRIFNRVGLVVCSYFLTHTHTHM